MSVEPSDATYHLNAGVLVYFLPLLLVVCYLAPYFTTHSSLRGIPAASFWAPFSNLWLALQARLVKRSIVVHAAHERLGKVVRIQPNHVSIADENAIRSIYGHGSGFLKADYYDAFVSLRRGMFSTRDKGEHARKRRIVSHSFSMRSVAQFEQYMHENLERLLKQWDQRSENAAGSFATVDASAWCNYLAFDVMGDLAFGKPFGMIQKAKDITEVRTKPDGPVTYSAAVSLLDARGEINGVLGCIPALIQYARWIPDPFFQKGLSGRLGVNGIGIARVDARLNSREKDDRVDLLARLMEGRDDSGKSLGRDELISEALTQLVAGSDTTANSIIAIIYWVLKTPRVLIQLQQELDSAIPDGTDIPEFTQIKDLKYLRAVINESLRIHSTSSIGLVRLVPQGPGVDLCGYHFPAGTNLSVPTFTMHHSREVLGR